MAEKHLKIGVCDKKSMRVSKEGRSGVELILPKGTKRGTVHIIKAKDYQKFLKVEECELCRLYNYEINKEFTKG